MLHSCPTPWGAPQPAHTFLTIPSLNDPILPGHLLPAGVLAVASVGVVMCLDSLDAPGTGNSAQLAKGRDWKGVSEEVH